MSYNIGGLKSKTSSFYNYVKDFDFFCLIETFVVDGSKENVEQKLSNFELYWIPAVKGNQFGRASGGLLCGYNKFRFKNSKAKFVNISGKILFSFEVNSKEIYLMPLYLNVNKWESDYECLCDFFDINKNFNCIIIGDLNVRVGDAQTVPKDLLIGSNLINHKRNSKDQFIDSKGKRLLSLCEEMSLIVLNGRVGEDEEGEFTFISSRGSSVIDLGLVPTSYLNLISSFKVGTVTYSDHLPLELYIYKDVNEPKESYLPLLPKLNWSIVKQIIKIILLTVTKRMIL